MNMAKKNDGFGGALIVTGVFGAVAVGSALWSWHSYKKEEAAKNTPEAIAAREEIGRQNAVARAEYERRLAEARAKGTANIAVMNNCLQGEVRLSPESAMSQINLYEYGKTVTKDNWTLLGYGALVRMMKGEGEVPLEVVGGMEFRCTDTLSDCDKVGISLISPYLEATVPYLGEMKKGDVREMSVLEAMRVMAGDWAKLLDVKCLARKS